MKNLICNVVFCVNFLKIFFFFFFFMLQDPLRIIFSLDWAMGGYFQFIRPPYAPMVSFYENSLLICVQEIYLIFRIHYFL